MLSITRSLNLEKEDVATIQEGLNVTPSNLHPNLSRITRSSGMPYHSEQMVILQKVIGTKDDQGTSQPHSDQMIDLAMIDEYDMLMHIIRM